MLSFEYPVYYCRVVRSFQLVVARVRSAQRAVQRRFVVPYFPRFVTAQPEYDFVSRKDIR